MDGNDSLLNAFMVFFTGRGFGRGFTDCCTTCAGAIGSEVKELTADVFVRSVVVNAEMFDGRIDLLAVRSVGVWIEDPVRPQTNVSVNFVEHLRVCLVGKGGRELSSSSESATMSSKPRAMLDRVKARKKCFDRVRKRQKYIHSSASRFSRHARYMYTTIFQARTHAIFHLCYESKQSVPWSFDTRCGNCLIIVSSLSTRLLNWSRVIPLRLTAQWASKRQAFSNEHSEMVQPLSSCFRCFSHQMPHGLRWLSLQFAFTRRPCLTSFF
jgi:hypothetical protein